MAAGLRRRIPVAPTKSLRQVAAESGHGRETVRKFVLDSGWRSLRRKKVPLISKDGRATRAARAAGLIQALKRGGFPGRIVFFSDEKNFVVDPSYNPQNDRYINFYEEESGEDDEEDMLAAGDAATAATSGKYIARSVSYTHLTLPTIYSV